MIYLTEEEVLGIARRVVADVLVRDQGLIASAVARPQASAFGEDAYPDLETKAGALLQSTVGNHALVDDNNRLGLAATIAFLGMNGRWLTLTNDEAYDLVIAVATGEVEDVKEIAAILSAGSELR